MNKNPGYFRFFSAAALLTLFWAGMLAAQGSVAIPKKATTAATGNDVDDAAIWVHPTDASKSVVVVNDKGTLANKGGLYVYDLGGKLLQMVAVYQPQNPDIRYDVAFGSDTMDVLVCVDRESGNSTYNKVRVFRIDPEKAQASSGFLTEITAAAGIPTGMSETYGHSLYKRPSDGALFSVVSAYGVKDFVQLRLESDGNGRVRGTTVRKWGSADISGDLCEGICCDDELGFIYICDENTCVLKYYADPAKNDNALVASFAQKDGIASDREGINIYRCGDNTGYILVSSQGNDEIKVYDRVTNAFKGTLTPAAMKDCDGLDVTAVPLGSQFPHGMAAFHLGSTAGSQFGFYDWSDIATGLNLAAPCDAARPRGAKGAAAISPRASSPCGPRPCPLVRYFPETGTLRIAGLTNSISLVAAFTVAGQCVGTLFSGSAAAGELNLRLNGCLPRSGVCLIKIFSKAGASFSTLITTR
jgi:3-phytase